jgi:hypothetical protein
MRISSICLSLTSPLGAGGFSPLKLFAGGNIGFTGNVAPSYGKTYQDAQATTLASALNDPIGLIKPQNTASNVGILDGTSGCYYSTPDSAALDFTTAIDIRVKVRPYDWTPAASMMLIAKRLNTSGNYAFQLMTDGKLMLYWYTSGGVFVSVTSSAAVSATDGSTNWVRFTRSGTSVNFYQSADGSAWTPVGIEQTAASASVSGSGIAVRIGTTGNNDSLLAGVVLQAQIYNGIAGTLVANFQPTSYASGSTFAAPTTGETWTLNGTAVIVPEVSLYQPTSANRPVLGGVPQGGVRNTLTYSQEFDNAAWDVKTNVTVSANAVTAPDGTATADTLSVTASTNTNFSRTGVIAVSANPTFSIYAKKGSSATTSNRFGIRNVTTAADLVYADVNYDTGAISYVVGASGVSVVDAGSGWWRISITPPSGVSLGNSLTIYCGYTGNAGVAGATWSLWGAQVEGGATASTYQTVGAQSDITQSGKPTIYLPLFDGTNDNLITGLTKFGTSKLFADSTAEPPGFMVPISGIIGAAATGVLLDSGNLRVTYTASTGVVSVTCRGTSTNLATTLAWGDPFCLVINYDGGTSLTAMLNSLTPETVTIGANADAGTVITMGSTSAGATYFKGWALAGMIDAGKAPAQLQNVAQYYMQLMGITPV